MQALAARLSILLVLPLLFGCSSKPATPTSTPAPIGPVIVATATTSVQPSVQPSASTLYVCVELANVRTGPSTNSPILKLLTQGSPVTPVKKNGEWYSLGTDSSGQESYINQSVLCAQQNTPVASTAGQNTPTASVTESGAVSCPNGCAEPPPGCTIKGNITSSNGEKLYYMQGDTNYVSVIIDPDYGERWFCTEAEAQENGWRRAPQ